MVSDEFRSYYPAIIKATDSSLAVVWRRDATPALILRFLDRETLLPLPGEPAVVAGASGHDVGSARLAAAPDGFGLSYRHVYPDGDSSCWARIYDGSGSLIGSASADAADVACSHPSMVHDGVNWAYFFVSAAVNIRWLEPDGAWLSVQSFADAGSNGAVGGYNPSDDLYVASYNAGFDGESNLEIVSAYMDASGTVLASDVRISNAPGESRNPQMVWNGSGFGVVWDDARNGDFQTYFAALDGTGAPIGPEQMVVADGWHVSIASSGQHYGLAWRNGENELKFKAIDLAGNDVGPEHTISIDVAIHAQNPDITWDGERFVVAWFENEQGIETERVFVAALCP